ncbi:MAG: glycosyltransferase [Syntrophobacteraceae bacterium]
MTDHSAGFYIHPPGKLSRAAVLDVGLKCVHSCRFCYYSYLDGTGDQFRGMRHAQFRTLPQCREILMRLKQNGFLHFDYTGGEPSIHPDIIEITRYAHQELCLHGRMITLGQFLLTKPKESRRGTLLDALLDAGLTNFLFSLHAVEEDLFHRTTGGSFRKLEQAMDNLDEKGFQYTSNTTVFEWNYPHLPAIARRVTEHAVYLHNFIIMNAYYQWNKDGRAFGIQAKYSDIYPYLREAVEILESNGVGVNIRYAPLCTVRGMERNLVGMVGVRYDPYEWMNMAGHMGGTPEFCASPIPLREGEIESHLFYRPFSGRHNNGVIVTGTRGGLKHFTDKCQDCAAMNVCDGIDPKYLELHGSQEFTPYHEPEESPVQKARSGYTIPFLVKTRQYAPMKQAAAAEFTKLNASPDRPAEASARSSLSGEARVSVIIPCFNYGRFLPDAVRSVVSQEFNDLEVIIVNDGSTDDSLQIARRLIAAHPCRTIRLIDQANSGQPAVSRNAGIARARGEYVICLDADDMLAPGMIKECFEVLRSDPSVSIVYTDRRDFGDVDQVVRTHAYNFERLKYANHLSYCALFRRKVWEDVGGYRTNVKGCEDWDFWVAAGARGHFGRYLPKPLFMYRRHGTGLYQEVLKDLRAKFSQIVLNNRSSYTDEDIGRASDYLRIIAAGPSDSPPMVSVVVPTRNRPEMLVEALQSILHQTYRDFEIIVINDGGTDEVAAITARLNSSGKIRYLKLPENLERSAARNAGIRISRGKYIAYLDDDDIFYPSHLETHVRYLLNTGCSVAYSGSCMAIQEKKNGRYVVGKKGVVPARPFDRSLLLAVNFIPLLSIVHERGCLERSGFFDEELRTHEDWDLLIRLSKHFDFGRIEKVTTEFRRRHDTSTTTNSMRLDFLRTMELVHERYRALCENNPAVLEMQRRAIQAERRAARRQLSQLGATLLERAEFKEAEKALGQALALAPQDPALLFNLGKVYCGLRQFQEAFLHLKLSTRIDPSNPEGWSLLSLAATETGDTVTAAEAAGRAGSLDML